jgi:hypothetical protein
MYCCCRKTQLSFQQALLVHETTHVGQQTRGEVSGGGVDPDQALETKAQAAGHQAEGQFSSFVNLKTVAHVPEGGRDWTDQVNGPSLEGGRVQRELDPQGA